MSNEYNVDNLGLNLPRRVQPVVNLPRQDDIVRVDDDIEVIDLDDRRGQIKPTTWH